MEIRVQNTFSSLLEKNSVEKKKYNNFFNFTKINFIYTKRKFKIYNMMNQNYFNIYIR